MVLRPQRRESMKRLLMVLTLMCVFSATALAGEMPGVTPKSVTSDVPTAGSTFTPGEVPTATGDTYGEVADVGYGSETGSGLVMTVLLTFITFI
jgi:hypothetical protein